MPDAASGLNLKIISVYPFFIVVIPVSADQVSRDILVVIIRALPVWVGRTTAIDNFICSYSLFDKSFCTSVAMM